MASENAINNPRIDRAFVNSSGQLTEYGYSVLARLIERVGGAVGEILNGRELSAAIQALSLAPQAPDLTPAIDMLRAEIAALPLHTPEQPEPAPFEPGCSELLALYQQLSERVAALESAP